MNNPKIDFSCVPYKRKITYWVITVPYLVVFAITAFFLWKLNITNLIIYIGLYVGSINLHGFVCLFSECPYKGTVCPAAFGWFPVGKIAGIFSKLKLTKISSLINFLFFIVIICLLGIIILPTIWLSTYGIIFSVGYFICMILHFFVFIFSICFGCAMKHLCPTAKLSNSLQKVFFWKRISKK